MVYTPVDHKTQVEPRDLGEWFHRQVLNILWRHFMVYRSIDHRKLPSFCILQYERDWLFSVEKARVLDPTSFLLSVSLLTIRS